MVITPSQPSEPTEKDRTVQENERGGLVLERRWKSQGGGKKPPRDVIGGLALGKRGGEEGEKKGKEVYSTNLGRVNKKEGGNEKLLCRVPTIRDLAPREGRVERKGGDLLSCKFFEKSRKPNRKPARRRGPRKTSRSHLSEEGGGENPLGRDNLPI